MAVDVASITVGDGPVVEVALDEAMVVVKVEVEVDADPDVDAGGAAVVVATDRVEPVMVRRVEPVLLPRGGETVRGADVAEVSGFAVEAAEVVAAAWPVRNARRGGMPLRRAGIGCTGIVATEAVGVGVVDAGRPVGAGTAPERVGGAAGAPLARSAPGATRGGVPAPKVHASTLPGCGE